MTTSAQDNTSPTLEERLRDPATVRQAFTQVIAEYSQPLYWQIRRLVDNHDDANDILQNTFLKAWSNIEIFRGEAKLSTWLHKIAINESLNFLEKENRRKGIPLDQAPEVQSLESGLPLDGDELGRHLRQAVHQLPPKQQLVFNMKYFDDMKYEDISNILGTSVGALKASYHSATKKIEKYFSDLN